MRQRHALIPTLREIPSEAEAASHKLMIRGGFIRPLAAGVYSYLPLGRKALRKLETIIREEMDRCGAQELLLPALQPAELWQQSGRHSLYGPELVRLRDRHDREFVLGPTHEEVVTALMRDSISSYRDLPMTLYQLQTKFRDERRPRFGLMRGREFLMKDAYSFDMDLGSLDRSYRAMYEAYHRIFARCGLRFKAVEADAGAIGGEGETHEFMALAAIGEDTVVSCLSCSYAANLEKAEAQPIAGAETAASSAVPACESFPTPGLHTIDQLVGALNVKPEELIKTLVYVADGVPVAVAVRGDHEVNEVKLKQYLQAEAVSLADDDVIARAGGGPAGSIGPVGLSVKLLVDRDAARIASAIAGANKAERHLRFVVPGRDFPLNHTGDFRNVQEQDRCPRCGGELAFSRGIEIGHVFKLGTKYSDKLGLRLPDASGKPSPVIMGCYGIGVSRLLAAIVEQHHDERGIRWPAAVAPFHVHLVPVAAQDREQMKLAESLYERLGLIGVEVLLDDREERAGVKFKDADLIGIPIRIVIGKGAAAGLVEYKERDGDSSAELTADEAVERVMAALKAW
ncbi:proline--tRNA ligase [Paenibacillus doosanensis]|uniref:proline--tRNA ligase n=1 Tax=Paenibacillus doosanensis TaxID=1229154 RepID=UPI00217F24F1|nr:proline--tRNA ligase [Paenibacillus doosanensis]MCS7464170.1 proline--tRNA ligase [Paenibacillus doosanensis]